MKKIIIAALALLCAVNNAEAFNAFGHQTIAVLADTYLTDNAKKGIYFLLVCSDDDIWNKTAKIVLNSEATDGKHL